VQPLGCLGGIPEVGRGGALLELLQVLLAL